MRRPAEAALVALCACGWLPADAPPQAPAPVDRDALAVEHTWTIASHLLGARANLTESDATALHGRTVEIRGGYTTPFHGACESATRLRKIRALAEVAVDHDLDAASRALINRHGLRGELSEYTLACREPRVPALTIYIASDRAMTCFHGVCFLLSR